MPTLIHPPTGVPVTVSEEMAASLGWPQTGDSATTKPVRRRRKKPDPAPEPVAGAQEMEAAGEPAASTTSETW